MSNPDPAAFVTAFAALCSCAAAMANIFITCYLAKYNVHATHNWESEKLFFNAKAEAYRALLHTASEFQTDPSAENALRLNADCTYALLFSSEETQDILSAYGKVLLTCNGNPASSDLVQAQVAAMRAMQAELGSLPYSQHQ